MQVRNKIDNLKIHFYSNVMHIYILFPLKSNIVISLVLFISCYPVCRYESGFIHVEVSIGFMSCGSLWLRELDCCKIAYKKTMNLSYIDKFTYQIIVQNIGLMIYKN